ncbi:peptidylprolyl isomerase [Ranunculus cassubicifolius]
MADQGISWVDVRISHKAEPGDKVSIRYRASFPHSAPGVYFDIIKESETPYKFTLGRNKVIEGLERGLQGMQVGGVRRITLDPKLAFKDAGVEGKVPPNSTVIYEVELVKLVKRVWHRHKEWTSL